MKNFKIKSYLRKFTESPPLPIFLIFTFFLHSCATPTLRQTARNIRKEIKSGDYEKALNVVLKEPTFKDVSEELYTLIENCDIAGYNSNKFDIPLLAEEFLRAGIDFNMNKRKAIDVQNIFHKMEQRTLVAAYKFYCDKDLTNAHSAEADTIATYEVLLSQLDKYDDLENDVNFLSDFSQRGGKFADMAGFVRYNEDGEEVLSFGKYKDVTLKQIWNDNPGYFSWINNADFPLYTKNVMRNFATKMKLENKFKS